MPAAVETLGGQATFASRQIPAWHGLGTVFDFDEVVNSSKILEIAHMDDWDVRLSPLPDHVEANDFAKDYFLVMRDNPFDRDKSDVLSVVGSRYNPIQNETVFSFGDNLLDGGGRWETAGSIKGGTVIFGAMAFDQQTITLDPTGRGDAINTYLLVTSSHDGSAPVSVLVTPVRVVCQNTLNVAVKGAKNVYKIRHTLNAKSSVEDARAALNVSVAYFDTFAAEAEKMIQAEITKSEFSKIVESLYPKPEDDKKGAEKKWANKIDLIEAIYTGQADGPDTMSTITGTAWGAFNALTERLDWYRGIRSGNKEAALTSAAGMDDNSTRERQRAWDAVRAVALV
jgi:phage/plasmid-like protein (TIGR03299 family)